MLDEATSNVDMRTDQLIQKVLRQHFKETTVITIAHRLNTIADYDWVLVMADGKIVEQDTPHMLIQKNGLFAEMVRLTGRNATVIANIARSKHNTNPNK